MQYTPNFSLKKPNYDDKIDVKDLNDNAEIIDSTLKATNDNITNLAAKVANLESLGHYLGGVTTKSALPATIAAAQAAFGSGTPTINDFASVLADETQDGHSSWYKITDVTETAIVWSSTPFHVDSNTIRDFTTSPIQTDEIATGAITTEKLSDSGVIGGTYGEDGTTRTLAFGGKFIVLEITVDEKGRTTIAREVTLTLPSTPSMNITLTDAAGDVTLPTTASGSITTKIQSLRNNVKALFSYFTNGVANQAIKLLTARTISVTGDATGSTSFDGSDNAPIALILANSGVTAGAYPRVTVDTKGRVTAGFTTVTWGQLCNKTGNA